MRTVFRMFLVALVAGATAAQAASIMGNGALYQEFKGFGGRYDIPYMTKRPVLDGVMASGEWDGTLYTEWGPSDLAAWGEKYGVIANEPGYIRTDGLCSQLLTSPLEDPSEALTDLDSYSRLWAGWDENYFYEAFQVTDSVYDVTGTQDGGFWERDGFFIQLDTGIGSENFLLLAFSAMPMDAARYSIYAAFFGKNDFHFYGDDPGFVKGTASGFSLTDDGWLLETRAAWELVNLLAPTPVKIGTGSTFGNGYHTLDPDGEDGFGGQFQFATGKDQSKVEEFSIWTLVGGPGITAVESTTWGGVKQLLSE